MELKRKGAEDTLDFAFDWRPQTNVIGISDSCVVGEQTKSVYL